MTFDPPTKQKQLLKELNACESDDQLHTVLAKINSWDYGPLYQWTDVLGKFDRILKVCCTTNGPENYAPLPVDMPEHSKMKELLLLILSFTGGLIENSTFTDYYSTEHLVSLLSSTDMKVVAKSMSILYTVHCKDIHSHIEVLANSWTGKASGLSMERCVQDVSLTNLPPEFTSLSYEPSGQCTAEIKFEKAHLESKTIDSTMNDLVRRHTISAELQFKLLHKLRLVKSFEAYSTRMECILARLYALALALAEPSYSNIKIEAQDSLLNELTDILKVKNDSDQMMMKVKVAALAVMHEYMSLKDVSSELNCLAEFIIDEIVPIAEQNPTKIVQAVDMLNLLEGDNGQACVRRIAALVKELEESSEQNELTTKLSTNRLHFLAVAAFQMPLVCLTELSRSKLINLLLALLDKLVDELLPLASNSIALPSWLCPLLSLIDQFEKYSLITKRRARVLTAYSARQWKWWDNYEWNQYDTNTNRAIDDAYQSGQLSCLYEQSGQTFSVHFGSMTYSKQMTNYEPIEWKPVVFLQAEMPKFSDCQSNQTKISPRQDADNAVIESCIGDLNHWLLGAMIALMKHPLIDANTLQAAIRLCIRVTRTNHELACKFYELGGITALLNITTGQRFDGIVPMAVSLIRHVFENDCVLRCSMESNILRTVDRCSSWPEGNREQHILMRTLNPLACRDPDLFVECAKSLLRIDLDVTNEVRFCRNDSHDIHVLKLDDMCAQSQELIKQLLDLIPQRFELEELDSNGNLLKSLHILSTNYLLYILTELVRLCRPIVHLILKHEYRAGLTKAITEKTSALEFICDHLLSVSCYSSLTGILFKCLIIASDQVPELIGQIVALLNRAISRVETPRKHHQIRALCRLLKEVLIFTSPCLTCQSICGQAMVNLANQGDKLVTDLANSFRWLNLSNSANLWASVSSILSTILWLMKALTDNSRHDDSGEQHGGVAKLPERYNRAERWNSRPNYQHCPLVHPFLLGIDELNKFRIGRNHLTSDNPYYRTCAPFEDPQSNYFQFLAEMAIHPQLSPRLPDASSLLQTNRITIFHGPNSEQTQRATHCVSCSACRWYQESCLVDGLAMFELTALAQPMLMDHLQQCKDMKEEIGERMFHDTSRQNGANNHRETPANHLITHKFVDHRGLCSLMCILFIENSYTDLNLMLKTLSHNEQTRSLIIGSLFDILDRTKQSLVNSTSSIDTVEPVTSATFWKSITFNMTSHLASSNDRVKLNVFRHSTGSSTSRPTISIHPDACEYISVDVFQMIMELIQDFPGLLSHKPNKQSDTKSSGQTTTFFDVLLSMDKSTQCDLPSTQNEVKLRDLPTELFRLLTHPVFKNNSLLINQLIPMLKAITNLFKERLKSNVQLEHEFCSEAEPNPLQTLVDFMFEITWFRDVQPLLSNVCNIYPNCAPLAYKMIRDALVTLADKVGLDLDLFNEQLTQLANNCNNNAKTITIPKKLFLNCSMLGNELVQPLVLLSVTFFKKLLTQVKSNKQFDDKINWSEDKSKVEQLDRLWDKFTVCLNLLTKNGDQQSALKLKPLIEAYFITSSPVRLNRSILYAENIQQQLSHILQNSNQVESEQSKLNETKFVAFITTHRLVLNRLLHEACLARSANLREPHWISGPFGVLVDFAQLLDFDIKRSVLQYENEQSHQANRHNRVRLTVTRNNTFEDSYHILNILTQSQWKSCFVVWFVDEEGRDGGGLLREWYVLMTKAIFNPNYALFTYAADQITCVVNPSSNINEHHLDYFRFVGKFIAKAIYDGQTLDCHFTRTLYKHILGKPVHYTDMELQDADYYRSLVFLLTHDVSELPSELRFCHEIDEYGVSRSVDLIPDGHNVIVTEDNKSDYVQQLCHVKMTGSIRTQLMAFLEGFYTLLPKRLIEMFNERELELLISGLPTIDLADLRRNTTYSGYDDHSPQIEWLWRALDTFDQTDRAKFLQFVSGTTKVPIDGFSSPQLANRRFTIQRADSSPDRLPTAHTCACQLNLPLYVTYEKLRQMVLKAVQEGHEGFGFV